MRSNDRHARGRDGYSLVELMVAMTAGAILISTGYILTRSSSDFFHRTSRIATTQAGVRLAAERLRGDIARAGFLGHPDTNGVSNDCGTDIAQGITSLGGDAATLRAVEMTAATAGPATNQLRQDQLVLTGNYVTNERYEMLGSGNFTTLVLDPADQAFRRTFEDLNTRALQNPAFMAAFSPRRLVRIELFEPSRRTFFRRIAASTGPPDTTDWTVTITPSLPTDCGFSASHFEGGFVAPVTSFVYEMVDPDDAAANVGQLSPYRAVGANMEWVLLRRELAYDAAGATRVAGSERILLEYALQFQLTALVCGNLGVACPLDELLVDTDLTGFNPSQVQGLRVGLAARTPELDPSFDPTGAFDRGLALSGTPLRSWRPLDLNEAVPEGGAADFEQQVGRARVRSVTFDVAMINNQL